MESIEIRLNEYIHERNQVILYLRSICKKYGDNDWDDNLHIVDIIDKHLIRHIQRILIKTV